VEQRGRRKSSPKHHEIVAGSCRRALLPAPALEKPLRVVPRAAHDGERTIENLAAGYPRWSPRGDALQTRCMSRPDPSSLAPVLAALSLATDLGGGFGDEAALRTAVLAQRLAAAAGFEPDVQAHAMWAGVLRFLGCTAYAHEEAQLVGGDDLAFLQTFADVDLASKPAMLARALAGLARGTGARNRLRALAAFLSDPHAGDEVSAAHCQLGEQLARDLAMPAEVCAALAQMYERWDGRGAPAGLPGAALAPATRVLHLAHVLEVHSRMHGESAALAEAARRSGRHFDPAIAAAAAAQGAALWQGFETGAMSALLLDAEPLPHLRIEGREGWRRIARAFAAYADVKSPYTVGHSFEVAAVAVAAGRRLNLPAATLERLEIAALLHDLGRVALPNGLWDAPRRFGPAERERVRLHSYHTERVLAQCEALADLADWAGAAHERLDGSGYHRRPGAAALPLPAQIIAAADAWVGMRSARAHRPALDEAAARAQLQRWVQRGAIAPAVAAAVDERAPAQVRSAHPAGLSERELEVLLAVARGLTNKQIARELGLSPRTVQTHLEHCFDKTGARSRSAAAIFAARHGLVPARGPSG
jgi:HD-GYP domain-containing protein (c-di-GMP phosphodiesterase class II)